MKKYCITIVTDGARVMTYPHNARGTHETARNARDRLISIIANNNDGDIKAVLGDVEKVQILPVECYTGGDPKQTVFGGE